MNTFNKCFIVKLFTLILSILLTCPYVLAEQIGTVTYVEGRVDVFRNNSETAAPIRANETISVGDAIRTKSNSKVEISFNDKSILRLAESTKVKVEAYKLTKDNYRETATIKLDRGKARAVIAKMKDSADFVISTPNAEGKITGSDVFAYYKAGNSSMLVSEGVLSVINPIYPHHEVIVPSGKVVLVPQQDVPGAPRSYLEFEKKIHEEDTYVPELVVKKGRGTIIRGAVSKVSGDVKITKKGKSIAHNATINKTILECDKIVTGENGSIQIIFDNGNSINLKPNTEIIVIKLVIDPETGQYENSFEAGMGKIMARIENLKGDSTFIVKTPTSTCGARGTIMHLEILENFTKVFYEGGEGFITSLISGITQLVGAGQNSSSDNIGNVSNPIYTSNEERQSTGAGWEPGGGTEGYSPAGSNIGTNLSGAGTGGGIGALGMGGGTESPFSNVPVTELISTSTGTGAAPGPVLTFAGTADGSFGHYVFLDLGTDTPAGERHLYEVYNALYGTSYPDNNAIEFLENGPAIGKGRFTSSEGSSIYFVARYAGARLNMKSYDIDDEYVMVTNLSGRSVIDTSCSMSYLVIPSESFGIWGQGSSLPRFYSEKMMNDDNEYHFIVLNAPVEYPNTYLIGFEDKSSGSDWDYNDFVFEIVDILPDYDATNMGRFLLPSVAQDPS